MFSKKFSNIKPGCSNFALPASPSLNGKRLIGMIAVLMLSLMPLGSAYAGDPATGSTDFNTTYGCSGCHVTPMPANTATLGAFSGMGSTVYALSFYAGSGGAVAGAANPGYSPIPAGNTYGCGALTTATCYMNSLAATLGSSGAPTTVANDISSYFASLFTPGVTNPGTLTYGSAATVSNQITGTYFVTSLTAGWSTSFSATGLPIGVSINASTGLISGTTPTVSAPTSYSVTVYAKNQGNATSGTASFTFTVNPPVPVITSAATVNVLVGTAFSYQITATNTPTNFYIGGTWPAGLTPTSPNYTASGLITGTPTQTGTFATPIVEAYNITGWGWKGLTINVWGITSATTASGTVGTAITPYNITTNGTLSGANPYSSSALPAGLTLNTATGAITGTPTAATAGTSVTVNALTTIGTTSQTVTFTIAKGTQNIVFGTAPTVVVGGSGSDAATVNSGLALAYSTLSTACSVNASGLVTGIHAGTSVCAITASQAGDANWNAATLTQTAFNIGQASQTITGFTVTPTSVSVGSTSLAAASSSVGLTPVTFSSSAGCTASGTNGSTITGNIVGTCTITANQAGNADYLPASATTPLTVGLIAQTISWGSTPTVVYGSSVLWTATASSGLTPVTFSTVSTGCSVTPTGTVTGLAAGTSNCAITATQAGNATYGVATTTLTVNVSKANQAITALTVPAITAGSSGTITATGGGSTSPVIFTSQTTGVCTVSGTNGSTVTGVSIGTCTIAANQAADANYNAAPQVTTSGSVNQGTQTIGTISFAPSTLSVGGTTTASATATSGLAVIFASTTTSVCTVSGSTVTSVTAGTCTITANQAGNVNYTAATQVTQNITVGQGSQTIGTISFTPPSLAVGGTTTASATATSSLAVTFTSLTTGVCTVSGTTVSGLAAGVCTIAANQAGNANYTAATQVTQNITVGQGSQTIGTISFAPAALSVGGTTTASATATSGLAVTFASTTTGVCTVSGSTVTGVTTGTCTITANQAGNANYTAATQVTQNITVGVAAAPAIAMNAQLNMPSTLDLSYLPGITGVNVTIAAAHGTVTVNGTKITYTPAPDYFGTDTFTYVYYAGGIASSSATITITITGRPDPTKNADVTGLINLETDTAKRFRQAQMLNFQQRLESRHHAAQPNAAAGFATETRAMSMMGGVESFGGEGLQPNAPQPQQASLLNGSMQASGPGNAFARNNASAQNVDGSGSPSSVLLANTIVSALSTSSVNLNLAALSAGTNANSAAGGLEIWGAGNMRFGTKNQPNGEVSFTTDGVSFGVDKRYNDQLTLGIGIGYAHDKSTVGLDGTGSTSNGSNVAGYASYQASPTMFIDGLLGFGALSLDTNRFVAPINDFARANRSGNQVFGSIATGYEYRGEGILLSPYARYDLAVDRLNAATETGAGLYALNYASQSVRSQQISLGFRAESQHQIDSGVALPRVRIEYQHHLEGADQTSIAYADLISTRYNLTIPTTNSNSLVFGMGSGFALHNGLNLDLDYQRQHSVSQENSQTLNFRLSKQLDGRNSQSPLEGFASSTGVMVDAGYSFDDNVTRACNSPMMADKYSDRSVSLNLSKGGNIPVSDFMQLALNGSLGMEQFRTYTGLGHASIGGQAELKYRASGEFETATYGVLVRAFTDQYQSMLRDGYRYSGGFTVRKPITDSINLFGAVSANVRRGKSAVFDTRDNSARMNLDYALDNRSSFYFTGEFRKGDLVFSGQPSIANVDISTVLVPDDVFTNPQLFDYRVKGKSVLTTLGYNIPLGPKDSVDISWRWVQSMPTVSPGFVTPGMEYIDNQIMIDYLIAL